MIIKDIPDTREITIIYNDGRIEDISVKKYENNMYYEVEEFIRLIHINGSAQEHNKYSLMELEIMDEARKQIGITFPADI